MSTDNNWPSICGLSWKPSEDEAAWDAHCLRHIKRERTLEAEVRRLREALTELLKHTL